MGSPCNRELALSSLYVMNASTSFSVSARDKQSLILLMFLRWKKQALQVYRHQLKSFSFLCGAQRIVGQKVSTKSLNGSYIFVSFTRILVLFGAKFQYSGNFLSHNALHSTKKTETLDAYNIGNMLI